MNGVGLLVCWLLYIDRHNELLHVKFCLSVSLSLSLSLLNRIGAMAVYIRPLFGVHFYGGVSPSKIGLIAPY
jgi:hypothetical protein